MSDDSAAGSDADQSPTEAGKFLLTDALCASLLTEYHSSKGLIGHQKQVTVQKMQVEASRNDLAEMALSDIYRLRVEYKMPEDGPEHMRTLNLLAKQLPDDPDSRQFVQEAKFDKREGKFYAKIIPDMMFFLSHHLPADSAGLQLPIPKCYYPTECTYDNEENLEPHQSILLLEDLTANDYFTPEFPKGLTIQQAKLALEAIAKMHVLSFATFQFLHNGRNPNEVYPFLFQTTAATDSYQQLFDRGLPQLAILLDTKPHMQPVMDAILLLEPNMKLIITALLQPVGFATLTHTDFWCNNLLYRSDNEHCIIVDWQMIAFSKPTNDVALLLVSSLDGDVRRQNESYLLNIYWDAFTDFCQQLNLQVDYTFEQLKEDYRKSQLLATLLCIGSVDMALGNRETEIRLMDALRDFYKDNLFSAQMVDTILEEYRAQNSRTPE